MCLVNAERVISEAPKQRGTNVDFCLLSVPYILHFGPGKGHLPYGLKWQFWIWYRALIFSVDKSKSFPVGQTTIKGMVPVYDEVRLETEVAMSVGTVLG